jgi:uncharacterized protein
MAAFAATACNMSAQSKAQNGVATEHIPARNFIDDQADLLTSEQEDALHDRLADAQKAYGPYLMVMTVKSLDGQSIEDYSFKLGNRLGIGDARRDDGLLMLVAPNERKVRIEVGYGLEGSFSGPFCAKIVEELIVPEFKTKRYPEGIMAGVDAMIEKMKAVPTIQTNGNAQTERLKEAG